MLQLQQVQTHDKGMPSKEEETRNENMLQVWKEGHIARDCKEKQMMKKRKVQEGLDNEDKKKEKGFGEDLE